MVTNGKTPYADLDPTKVAEFQTVQDREKFSLFFGSYERTGLLPAYGTLERDWQLNRVWKNDYNTLYKGAIMGLSKRIASTPFEVKAPEMYGDYFRDMLLQADLGNGWAAFIQKLVMDFSRYDRGAFVEIIGAGEAHEPLIGNAMGIAILDPLRVWFSDDRVHPIWYYGKDGILYKLHYTRVQQWVDMPESEEYAYRIGYGSLSRAISPVTMEILLGRYTTQLLDDNPPAGFVLFRNITNEMLRQAIELKERERQTDFGGDWGKIVRLYQMQGGDPIDVEFISYSQPPEKFDFAVYLDTIAKRLATAIGIDIQDLWELTGGTLGSGMQSEIMNRKARGKSLGLFYSQIERFINQILPEDVTFEFKFDDPQESAERAQAIQVWAGLVASLSNDLSAQERRQLLANNVPEFRDVLTDESGHIRTWDDVEQVDEDVVIPDTDIVDSDNTALADTTKSLGDTIGAFAQRMGRVLMGYADKTYTRFMARASLRTTLSVEGEKAYRAGKVKAGGAVELTRKDELELSRWRNEQDAYIGNLLDDVETGKLTIEKMPNRIGLWINKAIKGAYNLGTSNVSPNRFYMWRLGNTIDHCKTCLTANGQVHRMRAWKEAGVIPQTSRLQCGGWNCDCELVPIEGARLFGKGSLRNVRRTLKHHHHEHESEDVLWSKH